MKSGAREEGAARWRQKSGAFAHALQNLAEKPGTPYGAPASWSAERQFRFTMVVVLGSSRLHPTTKGP